MAKEMMNLFAVPVCKSSIERGFTDTELQFFENELKDTLPTVGNYASRNKRVLESPEMAGLKTIIQNNLDDYFKAVYNSTNKVRLKITQSWLAASRKGDSHHTHSHPNSVVSGVCYIKMASQDGITIKYTGEQLNQSDLDVWETIVNLARDQPLGACDSKGARVNLLLELRRAVLEVVRLLL